jgi:hypothetical protein
VRNGLQGCKYRRRHCSIIDGHQDPRHRQRNDASGSRASQRRPPLLLGEMKKAMPTVKTDLSSYVPCLITVSINEKTILEVIGKGGAVIRVLSEETGTQIDQRRRRGIYCIGLFCSRPRSQALYRLDDCMGQSGQNAQWYRAQATGHLAYCQRARQGLETDQRDSLTL